MIIGDSPLIALYDRSRDPRLNRSAGSTTSDVEPLARQGTDSRRISTLLPIADPIVCNLRLDGTERECEAIIPGVVSILERS